MNLDAFDDLVFDEKKSETNLREIAFKYLAYWKWFALSITLALVVAFYYLEHQTPQYKIQCSLLLKDDKKGLGQQDDLMKQLNMFSSSKVVDNEIEILKSRLLVGKAVRELNLNVHYFREGYFRDVELYKKSPVTLTVMRANARLYEEPLQVTIDNPGGLVVNGQHIVFDQATETPYGFLLFHRTEATLSEPIIVTVEDPSSLTESLISNLTIEASSKMSTVLLMTLTDALPQRGCDFFNKLFELYTLAGIDDKNQVAARTLAFIEERLKLISVELSDAEKRVENFKVGAKITDISEESKLFLNNVQQNDVELNQVKVNQQVINEIDRYVRSKAGTPVPATLGVTDPVMLALITQLVEAENKRLALMKVVRANNPMVRSIDDQIASLRKNILENITSLQKNLATTREQLEARNRAMEGMIRNIPGKERQLVDVSREQEIKNNLYLYLLQKREETALSYSSAVSDSRVVDTPLAGTQPVAPKKRLIFLVFGLVGLALPFGVIGLIDQLNDRIMRRKEITDATSAAILGDVSQTQHDHPLVVTKDGRSVFAEQVRVLRTNLAYLNPGKPLQTLLFTSSISGEGKSFVSLNLGASLAMMDKKTVILEFDLRKPKLSQALSVNGEKGISNFLVGQAGLEEILTPVDEQPNLSLISCGPIPPNPVELMTNGRLNELFEELKARFDYIIVDAPPIGVVTDAQVLEPHTDATLYVLRHDYTPKSYLKYIDSLYEGKKFKHLSLIFNGVRVGGRYGYGYNGYGYNGYGYGGYGYGVKEKKGNPVRNLFDRSRAK